MTFFPQHIHLNPGTHCFGTPQPTLIISEGSCVQQNVPKNAMPVVDQFTTTMPPAQQTVNNSGWRDFGYVVLGMTICAFGIIMGWFCFRMRTTFFMLSRHLLAMVTIVLNRKDSSLCFQNEQFFLRTSFEKF